MNRKLCFVFMCVFLIVPFTFARESVNISTTSDLLELNETLGDVRETITEVELRRTLAGGIIVTNERQTEFNQYLRFKGLNTTINTLQHAPKIIFSRNDAPVTEVGDWLHVQEGSGPFQAFFEYELEFEDGLETDVVNETLEDFRDVVMTILGRRYVIVKGKKRNVTISFDTLNNYVSGVVYERQTREFVLESQRYVVSVVAIQQTPSVSLEVNGELTPAIRDGDVFRLRDGTFVAATNIAYSPSGNGAVNVYLAKGRFEFSDVDYRDNEGGPLLGFTQDVKVNSERIEDAWIQTKGIELSGGKEFEVFSIKYKLDADALPGSRDLYVPPGHTVREYLDEPQGMIGGNWDIKHNGLDDVGVSLIKVNPSGDDEYDLEFENNQGSVYNFPYISNEAGVFKFGDDNDDLVFIEGNFTVPGVAMHNYSMPITGRNGVFEGFKEGIIPNIGLLDYFVLSDSGDNYDDTAISHIVRYNSLDTSSRQLQFDDEAHGSRRFVYEPANILGAVGRFEIVFGGNTYAGFIANATTSGPGESNDNPLFIDQNKDGRIDRDKVLITVKGGGIFDMMSAVSALSYSRTRNLTHLSDGGAITSATGPFGGTWSNTGISITNLTGPGGHNVTMSLITLSEDFDENLPSSLQGQSLPPTNEVTNWTIEKRPNNRIGLSRNSFWSNSGFTWWQPDENDDNYYEMNDYGVYFNLFNPPGNDTIETLTIEYPLQQRGAMVEVLGIDNQPPILEHIGDKRITIGRLLTIQLNATDPENETITYGTNAGSIIRSPFSFNTTSGLFQWQPLRTDLGNYVVTFSASDGEETTSEIIRISVFSQPTISVIGSPVIGNTVSLLLSDQYSANQFYILAMGLSNSTGFPLGDGRMFPLNFDEVFVTSLYYPHVLGLRDSVGILNPLGNAVARWSIPNIQELNGTTVYMAFVTINPNKPLPEAILALSDAAPITIRQ